ncbi:adenylate/guanylate cyclase domain-containing protein [Deinococcus cavernae]|uniref:Adenylate/guanylate cyclase domain-containing protein n=1 Tax=Deinococcus cavernae TaxID=2320857 RepID=A0A418VAH3_9DEIO|nr:adenylate/guanylate cyclase domain-containing protein [Deinococcus cavernae]RJF73032.1 adenylate/guanylate cyclase domain-containing protein [Deinococcus cavernae]
MNQRLLPLPRQRAQVQHVSVLMLDLVGSTRLARDLPLEHYAALMTELVQLLILSCEAWGGTVLQHQGDGVVACWPQEHTPQAVRCSLEAPQRVARLGLAQQLGVSLQVRGGVANGTVITGEVGSQITAYGLPLNLARRMCDAARPTETLVCADVAEWCQHAQAPLAFALRRDQPALRGFDGDCQAYTAATREQLNHSQMKVI